MLIPDSTVTKMIVPDSHPNLPQICISTNISVLYIHLRNEPDVSYERDANIVLAWYQITIPKAILLDNRLYLYQTSGADGYCSISEAF